MSHYDDTAVCLDDQGITIKNYFYPRLSHFIAYDSIRSATLIALGPLSGRYRLVGIGLRRPRHFFHWDAQRSRKSAAIEVDTGRTLKTVITPVDPVGVLEVLDRHITPAIGVRPGG